MNRYIAAGFLAAVVAMLGSGLDNLLDGIGSIIPSRSQPEPGAASIEQAGRVVQRQSQAATGIGFDNTPEDDALVRRPNGSSQGIPPVEIAPQDINLTPQPVDAAPGTSIRGDLAPIQPDLIQPGTPDLPGADQDLDSIPALW
jgi:hypothetical protein